MRAERGRQPPLLLLLHARLVLRDALPALHLVEELAAVEVLELLAERRAVGGRPAARGRGLAHHHVQAHVVLQEVQHA